MNLLAMLPIRITEIHECDAIGDAMKKLQLGPKNFF